MTSKLDYAELEKEIREELNKLLIKLDNVSSEFPRDAKYDLPDEETGEVSNEKKTEFFLQIVKNFLVRAAIPDVMEMKTELYEDYYSSQCY